MFTWILLIKKPFCRSTRVCGLPCGTCTWWKYLLQPFCQSHAEWQECCQYASIIQERRDGCVSTPTHDAKLQRTWRTWICLNINGSKIKVGTTIWWIIMFFKLILFLNSLWVFESGVWRMPFENCLANFHVSHIRIMRGVALLILLDYFTRYKREQTPTLEMYKN